MFKYILRQVAFCTLLITACLFFLKNEPLQAQSVISGVYGKRYFIMPVLTFCPNLGEPNHNGYKFLNAGGDLNLNRLFVMNRSFGVEGSYAVGRAVTLNGHIKHTSTLITPFEFDYLLYRLNYVTASFGYSRYKKTGLAYIGAYRGWSLSYYQLANEIQPKVFIINEKGKYELVNSDTERIKNPINNYFSLNYHFGKKNILYKSIFYDFGVRIVMLSSNVFTNEPLGSRVNQLEAFNFYLGIGTAL